MGCGGVASPDLGKIVEECQVFRILLVLRTEADFPTQESHHKEYSVLVLCYVLWDGSLDDPPATDVAGSEELREVGECQWVFHLFKSSLVVVLGASVVCHLPFSSSVDL